MLKVLYKPLGILAGVVGGLVAGAIFKRVWTKLAGENDPPNATDLDSTWAEVLSSALLQGAIFGGVKALVDRLGAEGFAKATGEWPGNTEPRHTETG